MALQFTTATGITITAASLASNVARSSAAVTSGTSNNTVSILVDISILTTSTAPSGNKQVVVYAYKSVDGTNYSGNSGTVDDVDGTDKTLTAIGAPSNLILIGTIQLNQGAVARTIKQSFDLVQALGAIYPKWGIVLHNDAGTALGATISAQYREGYYS